MTETPLILKMLKNLLLSQLFIWALAHATGSTFNLIHTHTLGIILISLAGWIVAGLMDRDYS